MVGLYLLSRLLAKLPSVTQQNADNSTSPIIYAYYNDKKIPCPVHLLLFDSHQLSIKGNNCDVVDNIKMSMYTCSVNSCEMLQNSKGWLLCKDCVFP